MGIRTKSLITVLLLGTVIGVVTMQVQNKELLKGQIFDQGNEEPTITEGNSNGGIARIDSTKLPDLKASIELKRPTKAEGDIIVSASIENIGEGSITESKPFKYAIYIDEVEAFSNTDSYSDMAPGDSFSFVYPIPRKIYQYKDQGAIKLSLDLDNNINESDEENNSIEVEYDFR